MTKKKGQIEIKKHFHYKMGRPNFSSADFGCEITDVCNREDAAIVGKNIYLMCKAEVQRDMAEFLGAVKDKEEAEIKAQRDRASGKSDKKATIAEVHEKAKDAAENVMDDIEIVPEN